MIHQVFVPRVEITGGGQSASEGVITILPRAHDATGLTLADAVSARDICPIFRKFPKNLNNAFLSVLDEVLNLGLDDGDLRVERIMVTVLAILSERVFLTGVNGHLRPVNLNLVLNTFELTSDIYRIESELLNCLAIVIMAKNPTH